MRFHLVSLAPLALVAATFTTSSAQATQQELTTELVAPVAGVPVFLHWAPGDRDRMFVGDLSGTVTIWEAGTPKPTPFLDVTGLVSTNGTQGLLGMVFHPDYQVNGWVFVNVTDPAGDTEISRYTVDPNDPDRLDPASKQVVLQIVQPYANHNGGGMMFGPDGYLYIATGDGGLNGDPGNRAQSENSMLGKMLRLDVDALPYTVPPGNMGLGRPTAFDEIFAVGLRHPWRFSFDRLRGDLWLGDVGQDLWEEIDWVQYSQTSGWPTFLNFGWRRLEGSHCFFPATNCVLPGANLVMPIHEYPHTFAPVFRCSVTGGFVYRGAAMARMNGRYFYADYCSGELFSLRRDFGGGPLIEQNHAPEIGNPGLVTTFGEDPDGELYMATSSGVVRIVPKGLRVQVDNHVAGQPTEIRVTGAPAGAIVRVGYSTSGLGALWLPQFGVLSSLASPQQLGTPVADGSGTATITRVAPGALIGQSIWIQAYVPSQSSNVYRLDVE